MNEEIKEILDMFAKYKDDWYSCEYKLKPKQCVILYDYITNLQEENQKLVKVIDELEKWLKDNIFYGDDDYYDMKAMGVESALNKLNELKGGSDEKVESEE